MTSATQAREQSGLSRSEAARRAGICEAYLRRVERKGAPYALARRLAAIYGCPLDLFLPTKTRKEGSKNPHIHPPADWRRSGRQASKKEV